MRKLVWIAVAAAAGLAAFLIPGQSPLAERPPSCAAPAVAPRYPDVQPIFERHCAKCHDARKARNESAQAVFEMSSYPFSTRRPDTLLADLRHMFEHRGALSAAEKCLGTAWITGGALDGEGNPPKWR